MWKRTRNVPGKGKMFNLPYEDFDVILVHFSQSNRCIPKTAGERGSERKKLHYEHQTLKPRAFNSEKNSPFIFLSHIFRFEGCWVF